MLANFKRFFKIQTAATISQRTLFPRDSSQNIQVAHAVINSFQYTRSAWRTKQIFRWKHWV